MEYYVYKLIHLGGLMLVFMGLGALSLRTPSGAETPRISGVLHGLGMFLILLGGGGMHAKNEAISGAPGWFLAKVGIWVVLGAMPVLIRKGIVPFAWGVSVILGMVAAYLAVQKPF